MFILRVAIVLLLVKNAAELMKNNENIKFIQYLETISKIATQGKHTFVIGDIQKNNLSQ